MGIIEVNSDNFKSEVLESKLPVLVDFNASWCPPCQALFPILRDLADDANDYKICAVDIDAEPALADEYQVSSIPCLVVFKDGAETTRSVGLRPKRRILKMLEV